jgi:GT2 family glycosyltransferase
MLSIVIPNLHSPIIDQTLASIRAQRFDLSVVEVLVVGLDAPGLVRQDALVRLISTGHPVPPAVARNIGLRAARGDIVVFIDADCVAEPDWLARLTAPYADPNVTVVGGAVTFEAENYWTLADNLSTFHEFLVGTAPGPRQLLASLNLSARREVLLAVGGFDERYPRAAGEDADLSYRLRAAGHTLLFEPRAVVHHRPTRRTPIALLRHAANFGRYSVKLRPTGDSGVGNWLLRHPPLLLALAPGIAAWAATRIFLRQPRLLRYAHTWPAIYAAKLAWCWGATRSPAWVRGRET